MLVEKTKEQIKNMTQDVPQISGYFVRLARNSSKFAEFIATANDIDLFKIVVCNHSSKKNFVWRNVDRSGDPPQVPFVVTQLLSGDAPSELEQYLAWAWLLLRSENNT